jgi:hypothetical protein
MTRWDRTTATAAWLVLIAFTALSSLLNARAAAFEPGASTEQILFHAAVPPAMLVAALFAELVALSSVHRPARAVVTFALAAVFGIALAASYIAVLEVTAAWNPNAPGWINAGLAAVPDIVMVMAGVTVLDLRMRRHGIAAAESRAPRPSRLRRLADAATARVEASLTVPVPATAPVPETAGGMFTDPAAEALESGDGRSAEPSADPLRASAGRSAEPSADPALEPFMASAIRLEEARLIRGKTAIDYATILRAVADGWSPTKVKSTYGYAHDTTRAVVEAAGEPALSAV